MFFSKVFFSSFISLFLIFNHAVSATETQKTSIDAINYDRLDAFFKVIVAKQRSNERIFAGTRYVPSGSRILRANKSRTRLQSNRIRFHYLKDDNLHYLSFYRQALMTLPSHIRFNQLGRDETIAYWLNLRNLYLIEKLTEKYPLKNIKNLYAELVTSKGLMVEGEALSIKDIEVKVLALYPYPRVIYGFYNGSIGGPNIRQKPFRGTHLSAQLDNNEDQFINSLRGTQFIGDTLKVSDFYLTYPTLFPTPATDVKSHLLPNLKIELRKRVQATTNIEFNIHDWYITDVPNNANATFSASTVSPAALFDSSVQKRYDIQENIGQLNKGRGVQVATNVSLKRKADIIALFISELMTAPE